MKTKIIIGADLLRGMAALVCKDETRSPINCVCLSVEKSQNKLIATNGRAMGVLLLMPNDLQYFTDAPTLPAKFIIPIPNFSKLGCGSAKIQIDQETQGEFRYITTFSFGQWRQVIEHNASKFPETDQVISPDMTPIPGLDLDLDLLGLFAEAVKKMGYQRPGYFHIRGGGDDQNGKARPLHLFPGQIRDRFYGVIMPLIREGNYTIPAWVKTETETPQKPADEPIQVRPEPMPANAPTEATPTQETAPQEPTPQPEL